MNEVYLYRRSLEYARQNDQVSLWRASHRANIACKKAIEESIRQGFDGMHLQEGCIQGVLEEYGFKRVNWVLANTVREKLWDGQFSQSNKEWARCQMIPPDPEHNCDFVVGSHPAVLDGFLREVRAELQKMNLFEAKHCCPDPPDAQDFAGKVLVVSPYSLLERYWSQENQLWYAHDRGEFIRATCLGDGEETFWHREDFIGVLKDEFLPAWASEKLKELTAQENHDFQPAKGPSKPDGPVLK